MKMIIISLTIFILSLPALAGMDVPPKGLTLENEAYVADIPFDTREIVLNLEMELAEESYVDDIPFNTLDVILTDGIVMEEEEEINDIPFDTECIVQKINKDGKNWNSCMLPLDGKTMIYETTSIDYQTILYFRLRI